MAKASSSLLLTTQISQNAYGQVGGHPRSLHVGVRARRWVTYHGLAINVDCNLCDFTKHVVPCGIGDRPVGSIRERLRSQQKRTVGGNGNEDEPPILIDEIDDKKVSVSIAADRALDAFEKVFDVSLVR